MMIKEIRRELKRQLQEMMHFKFNLFFQILEFDNGFSLSSIL